MTNLPKLMMAVIDFTANQITGTSLYSLSDGFLNDAVIFTVRLAENNVPFLRSYASAVKAASGSYCDAGHGSHSNDRM